MEIWIILIIFVIGFFKEWLWGRYFLKKSIKDFKKQPKNTKQEEIEDE